jgi:hypothetical protein
MPVECKIGFEVNQKVVAALENMTTMAPSAPITSLCNMDFLQLGRAMQEAYAFVELRAGV